MCITYVLYVMCSIAIRKRCAQRASSIKRRQIVYLGTFLKYVANVGLQHRTYRYVQSQ